MSFFDPIALTNESVTAHILPEFGFNMYELAVVVEGTPVSVLWYDDGILTGNARPSGSGIPILFPFAGRLHGTTLHWDGQQYELEPDDGMGNAIHGFVLDRPWRVTEQSPDSITGEFHCSEDAPDLINKWPSDFLIRMTYQLTPSGITAKITCINAGDELMPCGLGTHAYFQLPLSGDNAGECKLKLPVTRRWQMKDMIATGDCTLLEAHEDFENGMPYSSLILDDVFGGTIFERGVATAQIEDLEADVALEFTWDENCEYCVVYTPPHREAICIEPYTLIPGGQSFKPPYEGLLVLEPEESFTHECTLAVHPTQSHR